MNVTGLELPSLLVRLVESGWWPTKENISRQEKQPLVPAEAVRRLTKDNDFIYFSPPPFRTVLQEIEDHLERTGKPHPYWSLSFSALHELEADKTVVLGDFGMGSDALIALRYFGGNQAPSVWWLKIRSGLVHCGVNNHWVKCADTFDELAERLGSRPEKGACRNKEMPDHGSGIVSFEHAGRRFHHGEIIWCFKMLHLPDFDFGTSFPALLVRQDRKRRPRGRKEAAERAGQARPDRRVPHHCKVRRDERGVRSLVYLEELG